MSKYEYKYVEGIPVARYRYVNDAEGMRDIPIGTIRNDRLEDCPAEGRFIEKSSLENGSQCPICENPLAEDYVGSRGRRGGNVRRRSSAIYQLGCGHRFHAGCLLDYLTSTQTFVTIDANGNQTESSVPIDNIMTHAMEGREGGITCPDPTCYKICYTGHLIMTLEYFIGEEQERVPNGYFEQYDTAEYTGSVPPPEYVCYPNGCTVSGGKRKTKNKIKKKKRTKKKTKKIKKKLNKTKRKNSKK